MKNLFKKVLIGLIATISLMMIVPSAFAQNTILPKTDSTDCYMTISSFQQNGLTDKSSANTSNLLGCAINTGRVSLPMVPLFIQYFSNYLLGMVSVVALLFVVIGGLLWGLGGLTDQKDKGKKYITNALTGMVIAFLAWSIVNVIMAAITG